MFYFEVKLGLTKFVLCWDGLLICVRYRYRVTFVLILLLHSSSAILPHKNHNYLPRILVVFCYCLYACCI